MTELNSPSRRLLLGVALAAGVAPSVLAQSPGLEVRTRAGRLLGMMEDGVRVFKGVPYGEPPVGPLRFRPPRPARPWSGVREAKAFGASALQGSAAGLATPRPIPFSEDCLFLNVWTPTAPGPHPVLVWLHGGGNNGGSGALDPYNGAAFARDGVVAITVNWRLGALGFLELGEYLPDYAGSSTNALRDLILALTWVRENVAAFGGDPRRVTLGGVLGGSRNVMALLATPSAAGLFHRCIAESTGGYTYHTLEQAREVARLAVDGDAAKARALLTASPAEILTATNKARDAFTSNTPWRPVVDGRLTPRPPVQAFAAGASRGVPLLVGMVRDESPSTLPAGAKEKPFPITSEEFHSRDQSWLPTIDARYQAAFPQMSPLDRRYRLVMGESYLIPTLRAADARSRAGATTYFYRFDRILTEGRYNGYTISGSDVPFQFETLGKGGEVVPTEGTFKPQDYALAKTIHAAWVAFIKGGAPAAPGLPAWPPYDHRQRRTMLLNYESRVVADPFKGERELWDDFLTS